MEWQSIETAPKDGTLIVLGWLPNQVLEYQASAKWHNGRWSGGFIGATHWRPDRFKKPTTNYAEERD